VFDHHGISIDDETNSKRRLELNGNGESVAKANHSDASRRRIKH